MTVPPRRPFGRDGVRAPTGAQASAFDHEAIRGRGVPEPALMENAGRQTAVLTQLLYPDGPAVALVGTGNNGGDALVCLRCLAAWGREVVAVLAGPRSAQDPVLHGWSIPTLFAAEEGDDRLRTALAGAGVVLDGLLGTGLSGSPRPAYERLMTMAAESGRPVVALDTPSGVDGTTGEVPGGVLAADLTVAYGWPKRGTLFHPGRHHTGRLVAVEIGFPPDPDFESTVLTPGWAEARRPVRPTVTHKYAVGALALVAGSEGTEGAAVLAARAAFSSGVGVLRVLAPPAVRATLVAALPEAMVVDVHNPDQLAEAVQRSDALAIGPGMGTDAAAEAVLESVVAQRNAQPMVLDADALTLLGADTQRLQRLSSQGPIVLTPHPGEMGRLLPDDGEPLSQGGKPLSDEDASLADARKVGSQQGHERLRGIPLSEASGAVVLLKGTPSTVAAPNGRFLADVQGSSDLAVAGMGDTLTGCIGGLLAQGVDPFDAAGLGLFYTGRAAVRSGQGRSLKPSDVVDGLPGAIAETGPGESDLPFPWVTLDLDAVR